MCVHTPPDRIAVTFRFPPIRGQPSKCSNLLSDSESSLALEVSQSPPRGRQGSLRSSMLASPPPAGWGAPHYDLVLGILLASPGRHHDLEVLDPRSGRVMAQTFLSLPG